MVPVCFVLLYGSHFGTLPLTSTRLKSSYRFQVVLLTPDGKESEHWSDFKETAQSVARSMRERHPNASRVVVYDHRPTATEF